MTNTEPTYEELKQILTSISIDVGILPKILLQMSGIMCGY